MHAVRLSHSTAIMKQLHGICNGKVTSLQKVMVPLNVSMCASVSGARHGEGQSLASYRFRRPGVDSGGTPQWLCGGALVAAPNRRRAMLSSSVASRRRQDCPLLLSCLRTVTAGKSDARV